MPRGARVDAQGAAHHVMIRGIERRLIFHDDRDREDFASRLDRLVPELGFRCFAWAFMSNHVHLALQTGPVPLSRLMARLGTGYAAAFNRRHGRVGHLFQNRFRSRMLAGEGDLLGVVLYIHRNPLVDGLVPDPAILETFAWCGHGALTRARAPRPFESPEEARRLLADDPIEAIRCLRGWMEHPDPASSIRPPPPAASSRAWCVRSGGGDIEDLIAAVCAERGIAATAILSGRLQRDLVAARREIARRAVTELGIAGCEVARALRLSPASISRALDATPLSG